MTARTRHFRVLRMAMAAVLLVGLGGCSGGSEPRDPIETVNRGSYKFNDVLDTVILEPTAKGYLKLPQFAQTGLSNFATWTGYPATVVASVLHADLGNAGVATVHFLVNGLTIGFVDLLPNSEPDEIDFNDAAANIHVPPGPYLVLPIFGPGTLRSQIAGIVGGVLDPLNYSGEEAVRVVRIAAVPVGLVTFRGNNFDFINDIKYNSADPYARTRTFILQSPAGRRKGDEDAIIEDNNKAFEDFLDEDDGEETQ